MKHRTPVRLAALVLLLVGTCLAMPGFAAEPAGPSTPAALSSCAAAALFSLPSSPAPPSTFRDTDPATTCACGDAFCTGKAIHSSCPSPTTGRAYICMPVIGVCPVAPGPKCACDPAP
jgi:hypothetical protein